MAPSAGLPSPGTAQSRGAARLGEAAPVGRLGLDHGQPLFHDLLLHALLQFLEGTNLDLPHPLAADIILLAEWW